MPHLARRWVMVMMHCNVGEEVKQLDHRIATVFVAVVVTIGIRRGLRHHYSLSEQEM